LDESKVDKLALEHILGCFHSLDESQRCSSDPELFSQPDESKRAKKCLSSQSQLFSGLDESKENKLTLEHILSYFHNLDEGQRHLPDLELFSQPDESKRAEKVLELVIPSLFRLG
jgi:hypothetical protein